MEYGVASKNRLYGIHLKPLLAWTLYTIASVFTISCTLMKNILIMRYLMRIGISCFAFFGLAGCTENPSSPSQSGSGVVMRTQLDNTTAHSSSSAIRTAGSSVDSLL